MINRNLYDQYQRRKRRFGYRLCTYLEGTGTQYINTGFVPQMNTVNLSITMQLTNQSSYFLGSRQLISGTQRYIGYLYSGPTSQRLLWSASSYAPSNYDWSNGGTLTIQSRVLKFNGVTQLTALASSVVLINPILLFAMLDTSTYTTAVPKPGKIFGCYFGTGTSITKNFVPMLDPADRPCMYETISNTPYYNLGTDEFLYALA